MPGTITPERARFTLFVVLIVALTAVLFRTVPLIRTGLEIFTIVALLAVALSAVVNWQVARGLPRWAAAVNLLIVLILVVTIFIVFLVPPLIEQGRQLLAALPGLWATIVQRAGAVAARFPLLADQLDLSRLAQQLIAGTQMWLNTARNIFTSAMEAVAAILLIFVATFYLLLNPWPMVYGLRGLFPADWWGTVDRVAGHIAKRLRAWVLGVLLLGLIVGLLDYLGLLLLNAFYPVDLPFIYLFAILGGLLEVIPVVGPIISALLPALVALSIDPLLSLLVLLIFLVVQQVENYILVPLVMGRTVDLHPISLLFALVMLSALFGIFGALITVPVVSVVKALYDDWYYPLVHAGAAPPPTPDVDRSLRAKQPARPRKARKPRT